MGRGASTGTAAAPRRAWRHPTRRAKTGHRVWCHLICAEVRAGSREQAEEALARLLRDRPSPYGSRVRCAWGEAAAPAGEGWPVRLLVEHTDYSVLPAEKNPLAGSDGSEALARVLADAGLGVLGDEILTAQAERAAHARFASERVRVAGANGAEFHVRPGVFDMEALAAFTGGQCHALALALHERTGWPIVGLYRDSEDGGELVCPANLSHLLVQRPDGQLMDIEGAGEPAGLIAEPDWECLAPVDVETVRQLHTTGPWRAPEIELARSFCGELPIRSERRPDRPARSVGPGAGRTPP